MSLASVKSWHFVLVSQQDFYKRLIPLQVGRYCSHHSTSWQNSSFSLILWWRCWAFMDASIMQWRKALPGLHTQYTKWSLPTIDKIVHLVADWWPKMSWSREIVCERWLASILASMVNESMSTLRKFVVVAGFVTFSGLTAKPSSLHVAIMVVMLLSQTGESGGQTVK